MKSVNIAIAFLLFVSVIHAQDQSFDRNFRLSYDAFFYQDFLNFKSDRTGMAKLDIYIQVPYKNLQFIKSSQGFTAKYTITASIFDEKKEKLIVEKSWNESIDVIDFAQTVSKLNYNLSMRSFDLSPGNYSIRTALTDRDSKKEIVSENIYLVRDMKKNPDLSDVMLLSKADIANNQIVPNVTRNVTLSKNGLEFYFEIYSADSTDKNYTIQYEVSNKDKKILFKEIHEQKVKPGKNQIIESLKDLELDLGTFLLTVEIQDDDLNEITSVTKSFFSRWVGLPSSVTDLDKAISQMIYIASPEELDMIDETESSDQKLAAFLEFWKKKDPSPNNEDNEVFDEYYRRIAFANENFSNYNEGWRTDRGMVYVILGAPNNIDRHPFEYDSKPYEIWEYYDLNRSFIFLDQTGFGDYRLITPLTGDLFRYRY